MASNKGLGAVQVGLNDAQELLKAEGLGQEGDVGLAALVFTEDILGIPRNELKFVRRAQTGNDVQEIAT